jgi:hypothetical protein
MSCDLALLRFQTFFIPLRYPFFNDLKRRANKVNITTNPHLGTLKTKRPSAPPAKAQQKTTDTTPQTVQDSVDITSSATETPRKPLGQKLSRQIRRGFLSAASTGMAALNSILTIPVGIQMGLDTVKDMETERRAAESQSETTETSTRTAAEQKRLNAARISTLASTAASGAIGMAVLGPVGLVVGSVVGYLKGMVGNHLEVRSGIADQKMEKISSDVKNTVGSAKGAWAKTKAIFQGATSGAVEGYKTRKLTSKIQLSGMLDGVGEAVEDWKESKSEPVKELADGSEHNAFSQAAMRFSGGLFGTAGVLINAPGGMIIGTLESLKETSSYIPSQMEKNLMLWSTNVGKFLPAAIVSATFGVAAGTAVGVATASVTSIIDGRLGVNRKIARPVEKAVKEAHGEEGVKENLRAYYRAGKGSVVGLSAGVREGWNAGFQGGVEMLSDALAATPEAIEHTPKEDV